MVKRIIAILICISVLLPNAAFAYYITNTDTAKYYNYMLIDMPYEASPNVSVSKIFFSKCQLARQAEFTQKGQSISFRLEFAETGRYLVYLMAKLTGNVMVYIDDVPINDGLLANKTEWNRYIAGTYECKEAGIKTLRIENISDGPCKFTYMGAMLMQGDVYWFNTQQIASTLMLSEPKTSSYEIKDGNYYRYIQFTPDSVNSTPQANAAQKASLSFEINVDEAGKYKLTGRFFNNASMRGKYNLYINDMLALENYILGQNTSSKHDQLNVVAIGTHSLQKGKNMITLQCTDSESAANNTVYNVGIFALMAEKK